MTWQSWMFAHARFVVWTTLLFLFVLSSMAVYGVAHAHQNACMVDVFGNKFDCTKHRHYRKKKRIVIAHHTEKWRRAQARMHRAERDPHCLDRIRVVGTQRLGNARAKEDAMSIWREQVRFDHGSKFADFRNAKGVKTSCTQNRQGKTGSEYFFMCELSAVPCHAKTRSRDAREYE